MKKLSIIIAGLFLFNSCGAGQAKEEDSAAATEVSPSQAGIKDGLLPIPVPPASLTSPAEKAEVILLNFWSPLNFNDTTHTLNEVFMEGNFANFVSLFPYVEPSAIKKSVNKLMDTARINPLSYKALLKIADKYLYELDSPLYNEDFYIPFLEYQVESPKSSVVEKESASVILENVRKNRPGDIAADFSYQDRTGDAATLHTTYTDRDMMLIFFDPDCDNCKEIMDEISNDPHIREGINSGMMGILAIYSGDNREAWEEKAFTLPAGWIVGYEPGLIDDNGLYDLRTMPTIYLLSPDKTVVAKNYRYP